MSNHYVNMWKEAIVAFGMATEENQDSPLLK
jgi:hypothetical protein